MTTMIAIRSSLGKNCWSVRHIRVDMVRGIQGLMLNASGEDYRRQRVNKLLPEKIHQTRAQGHLEVSFIIMLC